MLTAEQFQRISQVIPRLQHANAQVLRDFMAHAFFARIPIGRDIFAQGDTVNAIGLLLDGAVRVYKMSHTGREITLYRFSAGESCIMTANAILNNQAFSAIATVEQDVEAIMIPSAVFRDWVGRHDVWRDFVFDLLSQRLASVIEVVDEVAFGRLDMRVAHLLLERAQKHNPVGITHQDIADELGSSREVITRILSSLAHQNLIQVGRGAIEITDISALENYLRL